MKAVQIKCWAKAGPPVVYCAAQVLMMHNQPPPPSPPSDIRWNISKQTNWLSISSRNFPSIPLGFKELYIQAHCSSNPPISSCGWPTRLVVLNTVMRSKSPWNKSISSSVWSISIPIIWRLSTILPVLWRPMPGAKSRAWSLWNQATRLEHP